MLDLDEVGCQIEIKIISLQSAEQRRAKMSKLLEGQRLPWSFFDAVDGRLIDYPKSYHRSRRLRCSGYDLDKREVGCFLSHQTLWSQCAAQNKIFLIMEDDVMLADGCNVRQFTDIQPLLMHILDSCPLQNLLVRLAGGQVRVAAPVISLMDQFKLVRSFKDHHGAIAYLISPHVAAKLVAASQSFFVAVDDFMWMGWEHGCNMLEVQPYPLDTPPEDENPSTIGAREKPKTSWLTKVRREWFRAIDKIRHHYYERRILAAYFRMNKQEMPK